MCPLPADLGLTVNKDLLEDARFEDFVPRVIDVPLDAPARLLFVRDKARVIHDFTCVSSEQHQVAPQTRDSTCFSVNMRERFEIPHSMDDAEQTKQTGLGARKERTTEKGDAGWYIKLLARVNFPEYVKQNKKGPVFRARGEILRKRMNRMHSLAPCVPSLPLFLFLEGFTQTGLRSHDLLFSRPFFPTALSGMPRRKSYSYDFQERLEGSAEEFPCIFSNNIAAGFMGEVPIQRMEYLSPVWQPVRSCSWR